MQLLLRSLPVALILLLSSQFKSVAASFTTVGSGLSTQQALKLGWDSDENNVDYLVSEGGFLFSDSVLAQGVGFGTDIGGGMTVVGIEGDVEFKALAPSRLTFAVFDLTLDTAPVGVAAYSDSNFGLRSIGDLVQVQFDFSGDTADVSALLPNSAITVTSFESLATTSPPVVDPVAVNEPLNLLPGLLLFGVLAIRKRNQMAL